MLDLIVNAIYKKPTAHKPDERKVERSEYDSSISIVAEDPVLYDAKRMEKDSEHKHGREKNMGDSYPERQSVLK